VVPEKGSRPFFMARKTEEGLLKRTKKESLSMHLLANLPTRRTSPIERLINSGQELALAGGRLIAAPSRIA
jgi:hypothetical protein